MVHDTAGGADPITARRDARGAAGVAGTGAERPPLPPGRAAVALAACAWRTAGLVVQRRIRQPAGRVGRRLGFADGTTATVYRETVIDRPPPGSPAVLVVSFRLRHARRRWAHGAFRIESELNTVLFAGFPGLISKLWLAHDEHHRYRGLYQWDDPDLAEAYVRALWWALAVVSERRSIHYAVLPGVDRDAVLADPGGIDRALRAAPGGWWRPVLPSGRPP